MKFFAFTVLMMCLVAMVRAECDSNCPRDRSPICGVRYYNSNIQFKTHANACSLDFYNCENPTKVYGIRGTDGMSCEYIGYTETTDA